MAYSDVGICSLGMQKLGAARIASFDDDSVEARECSACYAYLVDAELRRHPWNFAIARAQLAEDTDTPDFGPAAQYTLPSGFLRLLPKDPEEDIDDLDWRIEGQKILTNDSAPLEIRYIQRITDPNLFDPLFVQALACRIAFETAEKITQSAQKKSMVGDAYKDAIREAKRANGIENISRLPPSDAWDNARL
jgi:hypothetical protein